MKWERARRQIRLLRAGTSALAAIYKRDRNLRRLVGRLWFTATRQGLIGVRTWLIEAMPPAKTRPTPRHLSYSEWIEQFDLLKMPNVANAKRHVATLSLPDVLIIAVVTPESLPSLGRVVESWRTSIYQGWHGAVLVSSCWLPEDMVKLGSIVAADTRLSVLTNPEEIEAARQRFEYTLLCFGNVLLNPLSTYMFLEAAVRTGAEVLYSDHDRIDETGQRVAPVFKPQFSPEYISRYNYVGDCVLISRSIALADDDIRSLSQGTVLGYDRLVATVAAADRRVEHLPFVLFHVLGEQRRSAHDLPVIEDTGPRVAIIIPTRDGLDHLKPCIESILQKTSYNLNLVEIILIDNNSSKPAMLEYLDGFADDPTVRVLRYPFTFNFSEICNFGARASTCEILVFLNDDTLVRDPAWLSKLVRYADQTDVGAVGAKLLFPDGTIQHGGCVAAGGTVQHLLNCADPGDVAATDHTREISLVTGACLAVRRTVFDRVGGFDARLKITWNDTKFCLECLAAGFRNIYVADPLLTHYELKTRGADNTTERFIRYLGEADYTRRRFRGIFQDDPSYNPNLSLEQAGQLAEPPRVRRPWSRLDGLPLRILVLSSVYRFGFGVPLVIQQQVKKLTELGYHLIIGGPQGENEFNFEGCERVVLNSVKEAAAYAFMNDVALIISHTPPFFEVPNLIGPHIPVLAYDYGEPGAEFFHGPTRSYLLNVHHQKRAAAALTTTIATISQSVKNETLNKDAIVVGLANSHMPAWSETLWPQRNVIRHELGWDGAFVVLTVCRFGENERAYKGLNQIASIQREFPYLYPEQSKGLVWVLAGAGTCDDVRMVEQLGFTVFANVSDGRLADLYKAADAYMSFSKWEGYNLGIGQALAMGLPTVASDIPAHREFPIFTSNSTLVVCEWLAKEIVSRTAAGPSRRPNVSEWECSTEWFATIVMRLLKQSATQLPRCGTFSRLYG
jgi:GT2 family glycosyltransferase